MAQFKVTLETSADELVVGREESNEMAVEKASQRRQGKEQKRQGKAVEDEGKEEAVNYTYEQIDSMKLRELKEAAKKLRLSTVGNKQTLRNRLKDAMEDEESEEEEEEEEEEDKSKREEKSQRNHQFLSRDSNPESFAYRSKALPSDQRCPT
ncbi:hypothetical protein M0802_001945 [Mischocyttarus mexicanus]|nr:hypothetical protein M0802_001945 [Mischocyttarus mexicanus]